MDMDHDAMILGTFIVNLLHMVDLDLEAMSRVSRETEFPTRLCPFNCIFTWVSRHESPNHLRLACPCIGLACFAESCQYIFVPS